MAERDYTKYQQKVISRYYDNRDQIDETRLSELVTNLYLATAEKQKQKLWKERGYLHYERMDDEQLTDSLHTVIFPNITISFLPDHIIFFRSEPHPDDPNKCSFDLWSFVFPVDGITEGEVIMFGRRKFEEAEFCDHRTFDRGRGVPELAGQIVHQDMMLAEGQQRGMRSRGYADSYLAAQETRVRFFHEVLNDWLEGRR